MSYHLTGGRRISKARNRDRNKKNDTTAMKKLCISNRDEISIIEIEKIIYAKANGNYTDVAYTGGVKSTLSICLSKFEKTIQDIYKNENPCPFIRLGRSLIVNQLYVYHVHVPKQQLTLTDYNKIYVLCLPKQIIKAYKSLIVNHNKVKLP